MSTITDPPPFEDDEDDALEGPDVEVPTDAGNPEDAAAGAPETPDTTDEDGTPVENPSG
jgi:hypothetical protein